MNLPSIPTATRLIPGTPVPPLTVQTLQEKRWELSETTPKNFTMIVFYRGLHCPLCAEYLQVLEGILEKFNEIGVEVIAVSGDTHKQAIATQKEWKLKQLIIGYGLPPASMQRWGLYISKGELAEEPPIFNEPGVFLIKPDKSLFFAGVNNAPYGRSELNELLSGLNYVLNHNYPLRGTEIGYS